MTTRHWVIAASLVLAAITTYVVLAPDRPATGPLHAVDGGLYGVGFAPAEGSYFDGSLTIESEIAADAIVLDALPVNPINLTLVDAYVMGPDRSSAFYFFSGTVLEKASGMGKLFALPTSTTLGQLEQTLVFDQVDVNDGSWIVVMDYRIDDPTRTASVDGVELHYELDGRKFRDTNYGLRIVCGLEVREEDCDKDVRVDET